MQSSAINPDEYINDLSEDRKAAMQKLREIINENLPDGFREGMGYGMLGWCVPHTLFPAGYHCDPEKPLPFISLASQKSHIGFYHMGLYSNSELLNWFKNEWVKHCDKKLDMGKSCVRFKKTEDIPYGLLADLCKRITPRQWIEMYTSALSTRKS